MFPTHTCLLHTITLTHTHTTFYTQPCRTSSWSHTALHIQLFNWSILHHLLCLSLLPHPTGSFVLAYWKKLTCGVFGPLICFLREMLWYADDLFNKHTWDAYMLGYWIPSDLLVTEEAIVGWHQAIGYVDMEGNVLPSVPPGHRWCEVPEAFLYPELLDVPDQAKKWQLEMALAVRSVFCLPFVRDIVPRMAGVESQTAKWSPRASPVSWLECELRQELGLLPSLAFGWLCWDGTGSGQTTWTRIGAFRHMWKYIQKWAQICQDLRSCTTCLNHGIWTKTYLEHDPTCEQTATTDGLVGRFILLMMMMMTMNRN